MEGHDHPRVERKVAERNRRNRLKNLLSQLHSLLPNHASKTALPLPDKIDEAAEYIKRLKKKLEEMKESMIHQNKYHSSCTSNANVEVHEMGTNMHVILLTGIENYSRFCSIVRLLHEYGVEVVNSNFSKYGNSTIQVLHDQVAKADNNCFVATEILSRKLKEFINGTPSIDVEQQLQLWDYEIGYNDWSMEIINS